MVWNGTIKIHVTKTKGLFTITAAIIWGKPACLIYTNIKNLICNSSESHIFTQATEVQLVQLDLTCLSSWASAWLTDGWRTCTCNWDKSPAGTSSGTSVSWHFCSKPDSKGGDGEKVVHMLFMRKPVNSKYGNWGNQGEVTHQNTFLSRLCPKVVWMKCFYSWLHTK